LVLAMEVETGFYIELDGVGFPLIDSEANRFRAAEQHRRKLRETSFAVTFHALFRCNLDSFEVNRFRRVTDDVRLKDGNLIFDSQPNSTLPNPSYGAGAETFGVALEGTDTTFFECKRRIDIQHVLEVIERRRTQVGDVFRKRREVLLLKQKLAAD